MKRSLVAVAAAGVLGACYASAPAGQATPGGPIAGTKAPLPLAAFIDSAALHQALLAAPPVPAVLTRKPLFWVVYDSTGTLKEVEPISDKVIPPVWGDTMSALLRAHAAPRLAAPRESYELVWLVSGPAPRIEVVQNMEEERPSLANGSAIAQALDAVAGRLSASGAYGSGRRIEAVLSMRVDQHGMPQAPTLLRNSGNAQANRELLAVAAKMRFQPAQVAGYPVSTLVSIPVTIDIPASQPRDGGVTNRGGIGP